MITPLYVSLNGEMQLSSDPAIDASNRSFRFGDSLFETIRIVNGKPCFFQNHFSRLSAGMEVLRYTKNARFSKNYFLEQLHALIQKNNITEGGRARLTVFRDSTGNYAPDQNECGFLLEVSPYYFNEYEFPEAGLDVDIYSEIPKPVNKLSVFKTGNALIYIMAALYAKEKGLDDVLLVSDKGNILEASSSNVFIVSNGVLYTPTLEDGCVGGTMRMTIINLALEQNIKVYECPLTPQNLLAADEVFLTSSIRGIRWVSGYKSKRYFNTTAKLLTAHLNEKVTSSEKGLPETASKSHISFPSS